MNWPAAILRRGAWSCTEKDPRLLAHGVLALASWIRGGRLSSASFSFPSEPALTAADAALL